MTPDEERLIRENERMRTALLNILAYARNAALGGWRWDVSAMAETGLKRVEQEERR